MHTGTIKNFEPFVKCNQKTEWVHLRDSVNPDGRSLHTKGYRVEQAYLTLSCIVSHVCVTPQCCLFRVTMQISFHSRDGLQVLDKLIGARLDRMGSRRYLADMSEMNVSSSLLKVVAGSLALRFTDLVKQFPQRQHSELKSHLADLERLGLVKIQPLVGVSQPADDPDTADAVISITADGSKRAESLRSSLFGALIK